MFLVNDSPERRAHEIRTWLHRHPAISLLVAAAYFEWTLCRALLALSSRPNAQIRRDLAKIYGLDRYKDFWWTELQHLPDPRRLPEIIRNWHGVTDAFDVRNRLIHGRDRCTRNMASPKIEALLEAVTDLRQYAASRGAELDRRLPVRRREKPIHRATQT
jgi:hypothetical protein